MQQAAWRSGKRKAVDPVKAEMTMVDSDSDCEILDGPPMAVPIGGAGGHRDVCLREPRYGVSTRWHAAGATARWRQAGAGSWWCWLEAAAGHWRHEGVLGAHEATGYTDTLFGGLQSGLT